MLQVPTKHVAGCTPLGTLKKTKHVGVTPSKAWCHHSQQQGVHVRTAQVLLHAAPALICDVPLSASAATAGAGPQQLPSCLQVSICE